MVELEQRQSIREVVVREIGALWRDLVITSPEPLAEPAQTAHGVQREGVLTLDNLGMAYEVVFSGGPQAVPEDAAKSFGTLTSPSGVSAASLWSMSS